MGAFNGSISYKIYHVEGELPSSWKENYLSRIKHFAFEALTPEEDRDEAIGWVPIERPLENEFPLARVIYNDFLALGLRRDAYSISPDRQKAEIAAATREFLSSHESEKLTKAQKDQLKKDTRLRLKRDSLPSMKVIDMSWNLSEMEVRFWSQSPKIGEIFQALFEETFQLKLIPSNPYTRAVQLTDESTVEALANVEPSDFVHASVGVA